MFSFSYILIILPLNRNGHDCGHNFAHGISLTIKEKSMLSCIKSAIVSFVKEFFFLLKVYGWTSWIVII